MRQISRTRPIVAGVLVLAMVLMVSGLLGATGASVRLTSPKAGAKVSGTIDVRAAVKADQEVSYVILGVDEDRPQSSNSAPFTFQIDTRELTDGVHRIFIEAYDRYGLVGTSSIVKIYVRNGSPSSVQAAKSAATRVAAKPKAPAATRTASAPPAKPTRSTSPITVLSRAHVAATPATASGEATVAPIVVARGPLPAPTHSAAESSIAASRPDAGPMMTPAAVPASLAGGQIASRPPMSRVATAPAANTVTAHTVVLNGKVVRFDVSPRVVNGRIEAGMRSLFESQGARVTWNAQSRIARSVSTALTVEVPVGQQMAKVNGLPVNMGGAASIVQGRTMIPVRFFASAVGAGLCWDGATRTALLQTSDKQLAVRVPSD